MNEAFRRPMGPGMGGGRPGMAGGGPGMARGPQAGNREGRGERNRRNQGNGENRVRDELFGGGPPPGFGGPADGNPPPGFGPPSGPGGPGGPVAPVVWRPRWTWRLWTSWWHGCQRC